MIDDSMFEDIHEIAENSAYLKAVEEKDVCLDMWTQLPKYEELGDVERKLQEDGAITFDRIFHEPCGYYFIKCFLVADYAVDKAIFIKDVEAFRSMRFESARKKVAKLIYQRFVAQEDREFMEFKNGSSVFQIIQGKKQLVDDRSPLSNTGLINRDRAVGGGSPKGQSGSETEMERKASVSMLQMGNTNNPIGIYGVPIKTVKDKVNKGLAPNSLFDEIASEVMRDLKLDMFPRFRKSDFYQNYIRTKYIETVKVTVKDFTTFRALGRGGFGTVYACKKNNSGAIYAMKSVNKKQVKVKNALDNILEERTVLMMMNSNFVTNLKYALQDEESLYFIMDLMLGGDLKFHLINAGRFPELRAKFYAAQVLLGLEHVHSKGVIYRDMKLENILLDHQGHCRLSDLGLAVVTKVKYKGYAGTPGYTAPEMIKQRLYGPAVDIFSYGVMLYRMLCGTKPFKGKQEADLDKAVCEKKPDFKEKLFTEEAKDLLMNLMQKKPEQRLGCGPKGIDEIKEHLFFKSIDWGLLEAGYIDPPFVPNKFDVNTASQKDIGGMDVNKYKAQKLDDRFRERIKNFGYVSAVGLQEEMVAVLEKADENKNFEKFSQQPTPASQSSSDDKKGCCVML